MSRRTSSATSRLRQDYLRLKRDPVPYISAEPLPSNLLEWHYVVVGPEGSPYQHGMYHGKLVFPSQFPFKPPAIYMITPNGRFKTNTRLCLSISDYHPDTWNPAWSVATILTALLSFMLEKSVTFGSIETSDYVKREYAVKSHSYNLQDKIFVELFPEAAAKAKKIILANKKNSGESSASGSSSAVQNRNNGSNGAGAMQSTLTNFLVIGGFAAFAFVVQYVIQSIAASNE